MTKNNEHDLEIDYMEDGSLRINCYTCSRNLIRQIDHSTGFLVKSIGEWHTQLWEFEKQHPNSNFWLEYYK